MLMMRLHKVSFNLELDRNNSDILSNGYNEFVADLEEIISGKRYPRKWGKGAFFSQKVASADEIIIVLALKEHMQTVQDLHQKPFPSWSELTSSNYKGYHYGRITITPRRAVDDYTDHHAYVVRVMRLLDQWGLNWSIGYAEIAFDTEDFNEFCDLWLPLLPKYLRVKDVHLFHCKNGKGSKPVYEATLYGLDQYLRGDFTKIRKRPPLQWVGYDRRPFGHNVYRVECRLGKGGVKALGIIKPSDLISKRDRYWPKILSQFCLLDYDKLLDEMPEAINWVPDIANTVTVWQLKYLIEKTGLTRAELRKFFVQDHPKLNLDLQTEWSEAESLIRVPVT